MPRMTLIALAIIATAFVCGCTGIPPEESNRLSMIGLGKSPSKDNVEFLIKVLKEDPYDLARAQAATELGKMIAKERMLVEKDKQDISSIKLSVRGDLRTFSPKAYGPMIDAVLSDPSPFVRGDAALALSNDETFAESTKIYSSETPEKNGSTPALIVIDNSSYDAVGSIKKALRSETHPYALVKMIQALAALNARPEDELLNRLLSHKDTTVSAAALKEWGTK